jgi:hypothetical protein
METSDLASEDVSQLELIHRFGVSIIITKTNVIDKCRLPLIEVLMYWQIAEGIVSVRFKVGWYCNLIF